MTNRSRFEVDRNAAGRASVSETSPYPFHPDRYLPTGFIMNVKLNYSFNVTLKEVFLLQVLNLNIVCCFILRWNDCFLHCCKRRCKKIDRYFHTLVIWVKNSKNGAIFFVSIKINVEQNHIQSKSINVIILGQR
jgi:hypothetical protein